MLTSSEKTVNKNESRQPLTGKNGLSLKPPVQQHMAGDENLLDAVSSVSDTFQPTAQLSANDSINGITVSENHAVKELSGGKVDLHESGAKVENTTSSDSRLQSVGARSMAVQGQAIVGDSRDRGHEIWHLAQQEMGEVKPTTEINGTPVNDDKNLEKAADDNGAKIMQAKFAGPPDEQMK
jgi:hypothetical protein